MKIFVHHDLKELATEFAKNKSTLYIVGGYVRDSLLGKRTSDIDVTSNLQLPQVENIAKKLGWKYTSMSDRLGTAILSNKNLKMTYATFRTEKYKEGGEHAPYEVKFIKDIRKDSERRDFTVNAIYFDIIKELLVDFYNGLRDIKKRTLRTILEPEKVFASDGLRIMRLIRFAGQLNFKAEAKTFAEAKTRGPQLHYLSKERILKELTKIAASDNLERSISLMNSIDIWYHMLGLPRKFKMNNKFVEAIKACPSEYSFAMFICAVIFQKLEGAMGSISNLEFHVQGLIGKAGLNTNQETIDKVLMLYPMIHLFFAGNDYQALAIKYFPLKETLYQAFFQLGKYKLASLERYIQSCQNKNKPLAPYQLAVSPEQLLDAGVSSKNMTAVLNVLVYKCLRDNLANSKKELVAAALEVNSLINKQRQARQ